MDNKKKLKLHRPTRINNSTLQSKSIQSSQTTNNYQHQHHHHIRRHRRLPNHKHATQSKSHYIPLCISPPTGFMHADDVTSHANRPRDPF